MILADEAARRRALTSLGETLLVEAAAGTGKTALMAGRAAMLLASGVEPGAIAAITFTELAAGELASRIRIVVADVLAGDDVPAVLQLALPEGLSSTQRANLVAASARLDDLTATTIHGFCQGMIRAYAVEADLDPGAAVMDGPTADAMFEGVFALWLRRRLSGAPEDPGPVGVLAADDPLQVVATLRELALLRRGRSTARPPPVDLGLRPDLDFRDAVEGFERWFAGVPGEPRTADILGDLRRLADFFGDSLAKPCSFEELWRLARPPRMPFMKANGLDWRAYTLKTAWRAVGPAEAVTLFDAAKAHYDACRTTFAALMGQIAGALIFEVSASLDELLDDYADQKRAAAALDFDDLLLRARQLVREHEDVRRALGQRYQHIFVDEFQDTDPIQAEIIFALASDVLPENWTGAAPRPGSLFLVGDPKQAIYRFRGAHVAAYMEVRGALVARDPDAVIRITANFRSAAAILSHINQAFEGPLDQPGQPGYVPLAPVRDTPEGAVPFAAKLTVDLPPGTSAPQQRDAEAEAVAALCRRLVGAMDIRRTDNSYTPLEPADIALLAPTGTELWRYERALEAHGLGVASQAGKALMRRQETQDVLALLRTIADPLDRLAFGALMRGPLVGLTEGRLLSITRALPPEPDGRPAFFSIETDPALVADPEARSALEVLQCLAVRATRATPSALLTEAAERLKIRVTLALRIRDRAGRAIANLDALIALARAYRVRGLKAFVADLTADWTTGRPTTEGRIDESETAVSLVTIHSAKGLEWPVVIPINTATMLRGPEQFVHRQSDDTLHWILGGLVPPHLADAQAEEAVSAARERERLLYVALTRARDLLVLPHLTAADQRSWSRLVDLGVDRLPELTPAMLPLASPVAQRRVDNHQTREIFEAEAFAVAAASSPVTWRRPSQHDGDRTVTQEVVETDASVDGQEVILPLSAGRIRGVLVHKLIEELLTGELAAELGAVRTRAADLSAQLMVLEADETEAAPDATECAATALKAPMLPGISDLWPRLEPEVPIYSRDAEGVFIAGRADAIAVEDGRITAVLDWKSDLNPSSSERAGHVQQLADYLSLLDAPRGALVYLTLGETVWVSPEPS